MQIRVNKHNVSMNFEVLNVCSWCLLILNILVCDDPIESRPLLPGRRAYPRRRRSSAKTLEIWIWRAWGFFELRLDSAAFLSPKKLPKRVFWAPFGDPLFSRDGGPKCSRCNEILTFLTFGHFWEELGRRRILTVFRPNKNTIFMKTWGEFDGNHMCFFHDFQNVVF